MAKRKLTTRPTPPTVIQVGNPRHIHVRTAAFLPDNQVWTVGISPVPPHSPFREGEWVTCHGYSGEFPPGTRTRGWRGFVLGTFGATTLCGLTDDGREWCENWGRLYPDGTPCPDGRCVCHPRHPKWFAAEPEQPEQLELFALEGLLAGGLR
ncbi:hypothetical protein AB0M91_19705 [Micromonospora rifamycinica]|uniref:hypothetical protein n=1 Tax=Micromonospora rifamycinica TaxID=291594 RepID=UPI0034177235